MPRNTGNEEHICPYQPPNDAKKNRKAWGLTIHELKASTSGNPERRTTKEVVGKTFNLAEMESAHSGKMTKWKVAKKLNLKRWGVEALKEERLEVSSLKTSQNGKSARGFWEKSTKRRKLWETRKGLATKVAGRTWALVPGGAKEGISGTPEL